MKLLPGRKSTPSNIPNPFTGLKVIGWVVGGWVAYKTLVSALVPIGIGIRGLGLGLDNSSPFELRDIYSHRITVTITAHIIVKSLLESNAVMKPA